MIAWTSVPAKSLPDIGAKHQLEHVVVSYYLTFMTRELACPSINK